jgi:putative transposase
LITKKKYLKNKLNTSVGVDLGIKDFAITSDGKKFKNHDFFKSSMNELRIHQRSLARKQKGSNHYNQQKLKDTQIFSLCVVHIF